MPSPDAHRSPTPPAFLRREGLQPVIDELRGRGFTVVGPTVDQGAIVYDEIRDVARLPEGWADEQGPGRYRLVPREDRAWFGYAVGPHSWKRFLFPPASVMLEASREGGTWSFRVPDGPPPRFAFLGVRACELAAIGVQDRTFLGEHYRDPVYGGRRDAALVIAVNCSHPAETCFCSSMDTGPRCTAGFDLSLTELPDGFVVEIGSDAGADVLAAGGPRPATDDEITAAESVIRRTEERITKRFDAEGVRELLLGNLDHPRWSEVATRCLSCTNCTMVCPTCFCSSVAEVRDLQGDRVERRREWDSCFNPDFSYMNGGIVRNDIRSRYRQWLTHKLASWHDQFGTSGCDGCGRCITW
jgi:hypothetical protein